ncbi:hypothetical protein LJB96_03090 [Methanobrevibacter sp. OttesenSCG-928-K11]|nr:hypothetical protein [Methanobrevibacter sp. OttesenSCG-928-K11]MDL2270737.1 hypothetical protein [Methanobrevibacter sp. OttesenSCG-928-I08]
MNTKDYAIIIGLLVILAALSIGVAYNYGLFDYSTEEYDFEKFTMEVKSGTEFKNMTGSVGEKYYTSDDVSVTVYPTRETLDGGLAAFDAKTDIQITGTLLKPNEYSIELKTDMQIYKMDDGTYKAIYNPSGLFIIVEAKNLADLERMIDTIQLKNSTSNDNNVNTDTTQQSTSSNSDSSKQSEGYGDWQEDEFTGEYDSSGNPIYRTKMSTSKEGQYSPGIYESYWSANGLISTERIG